MPKLLILSKQAEEYAYLIESAALPQLDGITFQIEDDCEIVFGEPSLIRDVLPSLPHLKWIQSMWAGVEPQQLQSGTS